MISIPILLALLWVHTFADFVVQTDWMAKNKSKHNIVLTAHVVSYALFLLPFGLTFCALNFVLHWATDYVSSRMTSKLWKQERRHAFFIVVGIDQAIHITTLVLTYWWIGGW